MKFVKWKQENQGFGILSGIFPGFMIKIALEI